MNRMGRKKDAMFDLNGERPLLLRIQMTLFLSILVTGISKNSLNRTTQSRHGILGEHFEPI